MIKAETFVVVEFDLEARKIKNGSLKEFNERRRLEFSEGRYNKNMILLGVFETAIDANECIKEFNDIDKLIDTVLKSEEPY